MKSIICVLLIVSITLMGCAGTNPNPIAVYQMGDENKSHSALKAEIANIDKQIGHRQARVKKKGIDNILCLIGGAFVIVPWFFMDLKGAEQVEVDALRQRKDALIVIAVEKKRIVDEKAER
ncbi:hypothetical protein ES703_13574 [subsurface metagenome]